MATESPRPTGYQALIEKYNLPVIPNWHESYVVPGNVRRIEHAHGSVREFYPASYWPGETMGEQIEFALKYDGINRRHA